MRGPIIIEEEEAQEDEETYQHTDGTGCSM
jgi:hypothetical protein